jgi:hypothetical protein
LNAVRRELVTRYLADTRMNVGQIADLLGYAESRAVQSLVCPALRLDADTLEA